MSLEKFNNFNLSVERQGLLCDVKRFFPGNAQHCCALDADARRDEANEASIYVFQLTLYVLVAFGVNTVLFHPATRFLTQFFFLSIPVVARFIYPDM